MTDALVAPAQVGDNKQLQRHKRADEDVLVQGMTVGEVRLLGHVGLDADHGSYAGCLAVHFRRKAHWWSKPVPLDRQINRYFETKAKGCLLAKTIPLANGDALVFIHRALDQENLEDLADFQEYFAKFKAEREKERNEARAKAQAELDEKNKAEREAVERQIERMKLIGKSAITHLTSCKKDPEEAKAAREVLVKLKAIDAEERAAS